MITLDHAGFVGADIDSLRGTFGRLGFALTEPRELMRPDATTGAAVSLGQSSCHAVFRSGYIELSAVYSADPAHHLAAYRRRGTGLHILALGETQIAQRRARCLERGLACRPPALASRPIDYGRLHGLARFEWFMLEPEVSPEGLTCFAHNLDPQLVFQPEVSAHPNTALALLEVVVQAGDCDAARPRFDALLDAQPEAAGDGEARYALGATGCLSLLDPAAFLERFGRAGQDVPLDRFGGIAVQVADLAVAAERLRAAGVTTQRGRAGSSLLVHARDAGGAVLELVEEA